MNIKNGDDDGMGENWEFALKRSLLAKSKMAIIMKDPSGRVNYSCVECSAKYDEKEALEKHLLEHNREYRYLCVICGTGLKRKEHLERHTLEHQEVRPHVCPECGKAFKRKEHLNIHRSIHSGDKSESCPVCDKSFYRKDHLRKHLQTHSKAFVDYKKSLNMEFVDVKEEILDEDIRQIDDEHDEEMLESQAQNNGYNHCEDSSEFSVTTQVTKERPFQCPICHKTYKRKDHLKIHSWTHLRKTNVCSECGKAFHRHDQLLIHMHVHLKSFKDATSSTDDKHVLGQPILPHMDVEAMAAEDGLLIVREEPRPSSEYESRPHECAVCARRFKRKQHLKVHLNVHAKHQPTIWCSVCGEGFVTNRDFESHHCLPLEPEITTETYEDSDELQQTTPQEAKKENKYPQEFVDIEMLSDMAEQPKLVKTSQYEDEQSLPMPQKVFVCRFCAKPFRRKDHYKIHLHIHTGVKSFFCPECGKGFYRKDHMQKHLLVHTKLKTTTKKELPDLYPINMFKLEARKPQSEIKPEITIHAPSSTKLRLPLQMKVPYQMVTSLDNGEQRSVTIDPTHDQQ